MPAVDHLDDFEERARLFGEKLRQAFDAAHMTQLELVERTGISQGYLKLLLNGRGSHKNPKTGAYSPLNPTLDVVWRLAEALHVDAAYLVDHTRPVKQVAPRGR